MNCKDTSCSKRLVEPEKEVVTEEAEDVKEEEVKDEQ